MKKSQLEIKALKKGLNVSRLFKLVAEQGYEVSETMFRNAIRTGKFRKAEIEHAMDFIEDYVEKAKAPAVLPIKFRLALIDSNLTELWGEYVKVYGVDGHTYSYWWRSIDHPHDYHQYTIQHQAEKILKKMEEKK